MNITLQNRGIGQTWCLPIMGQGDLEQKRLMLQRFQEDVSHLKTDISDERSTADVLEKGQCEELKGAFDTAACKYSYKANSQA
ncbi:hypothetical protein CASFOL_036463 [Castilleja foliolosa]|uniref:Uncharacterized protein n=1 Tax=Castilleja foliolosa TaxID=1961234 RepID=A0ABD3BX85_9LAMI